MSMGQLEIALRLCRGRGGAAGRSPNVICVCRPWRGSLVALVAVVKGHIASRSASWVLLATGPLMGLCWGSSLIAARAWTWPIPPVAAAGYADALLAVVGCLVAAATTRRNPRRTRLGGVGSAGLVVLDVTMLAAVATLAPALAWPCSPPSQPASSASP